MKQKKTSPNTLHNHFSDRKMFELMVDEIGEGHFSANLDTPMRDDAFELSDEEKVARISEHFAAIMETLGLDLTDDSLRGTPLRVAKMYVNEIFAGLNPANAPKISLFENRYQYGEMLLEKNIKLHSFCEHHFLPIIGVAHVAYVPNGDVAGLSKINRIVEHYAKRPQVQERLTRQIANAIGEAFGTNDVAVVIDAAHYCVKLRGIKDTTSTTITAWYDGKFKQPNLKKEFLDHIYQNS